MNSKQLVAATLRGEKTNRTPIYGWVKENLSEQISAAFGSVENFEDHYQFDMAHIFGGPECFDYEKINEIKKQGIELTPEVMLEIPLKSPDNMEDYQGIIADLNHHSARDRFCYLQTNGLFECLNAPLGIENQLCYMALYPDEMQELYSRQAQWNMRFSENAIELGVDMIHISDDWGSQTSLMFNPDSWHELIYPALKTVADTVKKRGVFLSLHSDGYIAPVLDSIVDLGFDMIHPWQETAGMSYDLYLDHYSDKFAILGGLCIQSTLGFGDLGRVENEIKRVFSMLKGKRWIFCTTHFVQDHCSIKELTAAYDLALKLARE